MSKPKFRVTVRELLELPNSQGTISLKALGVAKFKDMPIKKLLRIANKALTLKLHSIWRAILETNPSVLTVDGVEPIVQKAAVSPGCHFFKFCHANFRDLQMEAFQQFLPLHFMLNNK